MNNYPTGGRPEAGDVFWGGRVTAARAPLGRRTRRTTAVVAAAAVLAGGWFGARRALVPVMVDGPGAQEYGPTWVGVPITLTLEFEATRLRVPAHLTSAIVPDLPAGVHVALLGIDDPTRTAFGDVEMFPGDPRWHLSRVLVPLAGQPLTGAAVRFAEVVTVDRPGVYDIAAPVFGWAAGPWRGHVTQGVTVHLTTTTGHPDYAGEYDVLGSPPTGP